MSIVSEFEELVERLERDLGDVYDEKSRAALATRDREWLIDQLAAVAAREAHLHENAHRGLTRSEQHVEPVEQRRRRLQRIRTMSLDAATLLATTERFRSLTREGLEKEGALVRPPHKGKETIGVANRGPAGEALLTEARDFFYALLFCDEAQGVRLERTRRDFLTVTLPSAKSGALERFMLAVTEMHAAGTWLDPEGVSDDVGAMNTILQVEYGDTDDEAVSDGLMATLGVINNLEVNEEILYARIEKIERSTLVQ